MKIIIINWGSRILNQLIMKIILKNDFFGSESMDFS